MGLGPCQMQWHLMMEKGMNLLMDPAQIIIVFNQKAIVKDVLRRRVDMGFVCMDLAEGLQAKGEIDLAYIKVAPTAWWVGIAFVQPGPCLPGIGTRTGPSFWWGRGGGYLSLSDRSRVADGNGKWGEWHVFCHRCGKMVFFLACQDGFFFYSCVYAPYNYEDSEVSLKRGKLRQIKAKTENPTYRPPPTCTPIPQCFLNKNQASLLLSHPKRCRHHPTTACFVSGRSLFTHSQNGGFP